MVATYVGQTLGQAVQECMRLFIHVHMCSPYLNANGASCKYNWIMFNYPGSEGLLVLTSYKLLVPAPTLDVVNNYVHT